MRRLKKPISKREVQAVIAAHMPLPGVINRQSEEVEEMASFNKIIIVGYLGRDPEMRYTPQGTAVCNFSVATTEKRKDKAGDSQEVTTWFRVTVWGKQAEFVNEYLTKGRQVYIEGRLRQDEYTDRDGNKRQTLEVTATEIQALGAKGDKAKTPTEEIREGAGLPETDEDLPF